MSVLFTDNDRVSTRARQALPALLTLIGLSAGAPTRADTIEGQIVDGDGNPLSGVQIVYTRDAELPGASVVTIFSGDDGSFRFPGEFPEATSEASHIAARGLGFQQVERIVETGPGATSLVFVLERVANQVDGAPASAWLTGIGGRAGQAAFIMNCIDCHQVPASEVRGYARAMDDLHAPDPVLARRQSWDSIVRYMYFL